MQIIRRQITNKLEWLDWRRSDVTASDIGAICGVNPYKTALQVWGEKAGAVPEPEENNAMRAGRWLEDAVITAMRDRHPDWIIVKPGVYLNAPEHRIGATPDATATDEHGRSVNIQCKTVGRTAFDGWEGTPPLGYQLQVAIEAMLLEADYSILAVLTRSEWEMELHEFRIDRNAKAEDRALDMVKAFWDSIGEGKTPAVDYSRDLDLIAKLKPPKPGLEPLVFVNDNELPVLIAEYIRLGETIKEDEERRKAIKATFVDKLDSHPMAICNGWCIRHQIQHQHVKAREAYERDVSVLTVKKDKERPGWLTSTS